MRAATGLLKVPVASGADTISLKLRLHKYRQGGSWTAGWRTGLWNGGHRHEGLSALILFLHTSLVYVELQHIPVAETAIKSSKYHMFCSF